MKFITLFAIIGIALCSSNNILLQKPDQERFEEIFSELTKGEKKGDFGFDLFTQLKTKVQTGGDVSDIQDHIVVLKNHLQTDQSTDDDFYNNERTNINGQVDVLDRQLVQLEEQQNFLEEKLRVLNSQSNIIDSLFSSDSQAYATRVGTQNAMLQTLNTLTERIRANLVDGQSLIQKSDLFEELKKIGRGKHVEVLAQLTAHLDQNQITQILALFEQLKTAIQESLQADELKEQENIRLHNSLREEIGRLIPETDTRLGEVLDQIDDRQSQKDQLRQRLTTLTEAYQDRTDHRNNALGKTNQAQDLLENNLQRLVKWEQLANQTPLEQE